MMDRAKNPTVGIIGAGFSGLNAARTLINHGLNVRLFEKSRGPGGRMASRRTEGSTFDHGAQYFTARDPRFEQYVRTWINQGLVEPWRGRIAQAQGGRIAPKPDDTVRYVGVPRMSALTRYLSSGLDIRYQMRIARVKRSDGRWQLTGDQGEHAGRFDVLLVTTPPAQAKTLLKDAPHLAKQIEAASMLPCWAVMVAFEQALQLEYDGIFVHDADISWAARNTSKPGRERGESWVLHGSPAWSRANLEADAEAVARRLLSTFFDVTGLNPVDPCFLQAHRWRFALAEQSLETGCLWDDDIMIGVCGDWCVNSRIEGAYLSGTAAAGRVLGLPDQGITGVDGGLSTVRPR